MYLFIYLVSYYEFKKSDKNNTHNCVIHCITRNKIAFIFHYDNPNY